MHCVICGAFVSGLRGFVGVIVGRSRIRVDRGD